MSQALRVALWVPPTEPPAIGSGVKSINNPRPAGGSIPTEFDLFGGGSGGGITEAPSDGTPYARQDEDWVPTPGPVLDGGTF